MLRAAVDTAANPSGAVASMAGNPSGAVASIAGNPSGARGAASPGRAVLSAPPGLPSSAFHAPLAPEPAPQLSRNALTRAHVSPLSRDVRPFLERPIRPAPGRLSLAASAGPLRGRARRAAGPARGRRGRVSSAPREEPRQRPGSGSAQAERPRLRPQLSLGRGCGMWELLRARSGHEELRPVLALYLQGCRMPCRAAGVPGLFRSLLVLS
ncbi:unnamed protein product [Coccothraustes coccothraustes]